MQPWLVTEGHRLATMLLLDCLTLNSCCPPQCPVDSWQSSFKKPNSVGSSLDWNVHCELHTIVIIVSWQE